MAVRSPSNSSKLCPPFGNKWSLYFIGTVLVMENSSAGFELPPVSIPIVYTFLHTELLPRRGAAIGRGGSAVEQMYKRNVLAIACC